MIKCVNVTLTAAEGFFVLGPFLSCQSRILTAFRSLGSDTFFLLQAALVSGGRVPAAAELDAGEQLLPMPALQVPLPEDGTALRGAAFETFIPVEVPGDGRYVALRIDSVLSTIEGFVAIE